MCTLKLLKTEIKVIDKYRKDCLWRGIDINKKGYNLAAWTMATVPKDKGGLGVKNLYLLSTKYRRQPSEGYPTKVD